MSYLGKVTGDWSDRPVYVVGGGPSLAPHVDALKWRHEFYVLGVNRAAELLGPTNVDATFSLDRMFIDRYHDRLYEWANPEDPYHEVYLAVAAGWDESHALVPGATYLERRAMAGLSEDPAAVANGLNSGYGALNLATLKGAREIYLLGFDFNEPAPTEPTHWHDGYDWGNRSAVKYWSRWAARFDAAAADCERLGVKVWNANPTSLVRAFPFVTYEDLGL